MKTWLRWCGVLTVLLGSVSSFAQTCPTPPASWRPPLKWFCPNQPAMADEVNANFGQVVSWLEAKVGRVDAGISFAPGSVSTAALANDAVTGAKVAPGTLDATDLAPGAIGSDRVRDGGVPVYVVTNSQCTTSGLTLSPTCVRTTGICGAALCGSSVAIPVYFRCNSACGNSSPCQSAPAVCTEQNVYVGALVP